MKKILYAFLSLLPLASQAQNNNGTIDQIEELSTKLSVPIRTPGGARLMTDVYLPITSDSLVLSIPLFGQNYRVEFIPKGTQLIVYPDMLDAAGGLLQNPNPFQLPLILSRTPYGKNGIQPAGGAITLLGYAFANQDIRGRYESEGTYLPLYSDSWRKTPYISHNNLLDISLPSDSANGRFQEDGWTTYQYLLDSLYRDYDLDGNGTLETREWLHNGTIGMAGASAFGMPSLQLAASRRINPLLPGLKGNLSVVSTGEHFYCTTYHNGVFRQELVDGWLDTQFDDLDDTVTTDNSLQNAIHSPFDYGQLTKQAVKDLAVDYVTRYRYPGASVCNAYPNSPGRALLDISKAPVDANGEGLANGPQSRYRNMQVPMYHLTGWYDIFINGQLETWRQLKQHSGKAQKIVIGPWAHTTLTMRTSGDATYPPSVQSLLGFSGDNFDLNNPGSLDIGSILNTEPLAFMRYALNDQGFVRLGEPSVRIPRGRSWQQAGTFRLRVPGEDYYFSLPQLLNFISGNGSLPQVPITVDLGFGATTTLRLDIPSIGSVLPIPIGPVQAPTPVNFDTVADVRLYVIGPLDSVSGNQQVGNYWLSSNVFPLPAPAVRYDSFYLHQNGSVDEFAPSSDEGLLSYDHDPENPVYSVGGNNLFLRTPQGDRDSHGQMNYADTAFAAYTLNHPGVISFETAPMTDTLCIIGVPKASIYAKSQPQGLTAGLTDTDFFVRILDVYPDGRELLVVEGAVNARAREYARSLYNGQENDNAPYSNIQIGQVYEYQFELLPIAYTFGYQHKMKVLISSSNYPRYQSNPNLPIEDGDFFRRKPGDGRQYTFQGQTLSPRVATNSIAFAPGRASRLELPVYRREPNSLSQAEGPSLEFSLQPNPSAGSTRVLFGEQGDYRVELFNNLGQLVWQAGCEQCQSLDLALEQLSAGSYQVKVHRANGLSQVKTLLKK